MILEIHEASQVLVEDETRRALRPGKREPFQAAFAEGAFDSLNLLRVLSRTARMHTSVGNTKNMEELFTDI